MTANRHGSKAGAHRTSVLVIDDSDLDRAAIHEVLADAGYLVHDLPTPIGATRKAREVGAQVIVIDQNLPAMDGSKLASLFRGSPLMRGMSVILVSGDDDQVMAEIARQAQADAFVGKHNLHRDLVPTVKRVLEAKADAGRDKR